MLTVTPVRYRSGVIRQAEAARHVSQRVQVGRFRLDSQLHIPDKPRGVVLCIGDGGSSLLDLEHRAVAIALNDAAIATVLIDLLTDEERADTCVAAYRRNDIQLLASRAVGATDWLGVDVPTRDLPIGYFGTGVGAAIGLAAAAGRPASVSAIVCFGGRPLLVRPALPQVRAPTLLMVYEADRALVKLNRSALSQMLGEKCLQVVPMVNDSFAIEAMLKPARDWFQQYLVPPA
jgi:dienelactone hydrolase